MSEPAKESKALKPYFAARPRRRLFGCLPASILMAVTVGLWCLSAMQFMLADHHLDYAVLLAAFPVVLAVILKLNHAPRRYIPLAICVISVLTFLLMAALCSNVNMTLPHPEESPAPPPRMPPETAPSTPATHRLPESIGMLRATRSPRRSG